LPRHQRPKRCLLTTGAQVPFIRHHE
jgi:hypothetical protein